MAVTLDAPPPPIPSPGLPFVGTQAAGGIALLGAAVIAILWANSQWLETYFALWETPLRVAVGAKGLEMTLHQFVNDGLMAVFFFVVGLEIKREILAGELATLRTAALPLVSAFGGMIVPAALYLLLTAGGPAEVGWGVPMATDIAFALAVLALLGSRVPLGAKVFLTALAIIDDIGAILVIAVFYSHGVNWPAVGTAAATLLLAIWLNRSGVRRIWPFAALGVVLWGAVWTSGVHTTVAGVLLAMTVPAFPKVDEVTFIDASHDALVGFEAVSAVGPAAASSVLPNAKRHDALNEIRRLGKLARSPLVELERRLHGPVAFGVLPLFALANAGVSLDTSVLGPAMRNPVLPGVMLGLVLGKPIGILGFTWLFVRLGVCSLPDGVGWRTVLALGILGGVGFTMSLFIASLAFGPGPELEAAKVAILSASAFAGLAGWAILKGVSGPPRPI